MGKFKVLKTVLIPFLILLLIIAGILYYFSSISTKYNNNLILGNTPGNLVNHGLFCEHNNKVYFSNPYDDNSLYVMDSTGENITKLSADAVLGINADDNYIYYVRNTDNSSSGFGFLHYNTNGLCRVNLNGTHFTVLDDSPSLSPSLLGNYIYYLHYDTKEATTLYRINIDKTNKEQISDLALNFSGISSKGIYYNNLSDNSYIYLFNPKINNSSAIYKRNAALVIPDESYIYFLDSTRNYILCRYNIENDETQEITDKRVDCYNIYGNYLYYQTNDDDDSALFRCKKDGSDSELISQGIYTDINVTSKYIYFYKYGSDTALFTIPSTGSLDMQPVTFE